MSKVLLLDSRYTVVVHPKGPFSFDHITRKYQDPDPIMREVTFETGDLVRWPYEVTNEPDRESNDFILWAKAQERDFLIRDHAIRRNREIAEFFLLDAIDVIETPYPLFLVWIVNVIKKIRRLFGSPVDSILLKKRYLHLLKTQVISTANDWIRVQAAAKAKEVSQDDVLDAAVRSFRDDMGR